MNHFVQGFYLKSVESVALCSLCIMYLKLHNYPLKHINSAFTIKTKHPLDIPVFRENVSHFFQKSESMKT